MMTKARRAPLQGMPLQRHGTRGCYVQRKCRCDLCKAANRDYYHQRKAIEDAAAEEAAPPAAGGFVHTFRNAAGERRQRIYKRACPGVNGRPCPRYAHLRKDSKGGLCIACRKALVFDGLVDAAAARKHLRKLSRRKVGYKQVADSACVSITVVARILSGEKTQIRASTARKILEVDDGAIADHATVPAAATWKLLERLLKEGFTKAELARRLGYSRAALQIGRKRVLARTAQKVERFYDMIMVGA